MRYEREFAIAIQFVRKHYAEMYAQAEYISLCPSDIFPAHQLGQCSHDNFISVSDRISTTGEFVDTLVHELTHACQNKSGERMSDLKREEEAYAAGIQAANFYEREAAPWARRK